MRDYRGTVDLSVMIDRDGPEPPYLQVAAAIEARIKSGELGPGARVPSIADLMGTYDIGKNTAIRAITVLKERGLVETRQGWGTFVTNTRESE